MAKKMAREARTGKFLTGTSCGRSSVVCLRDGFIDGVGGAATVIDAKRMNHRTYKGRGLKGDWIAVGDSLRRMTKAAS